MTMESVSENNLPTNPRLGTPIHIKSLVPIPRHLAKVQKILQQLPYLNQLDRYFASQVQAMKEKRHPLEGLTAPASSKQTLDSEERTLTAQLGPD